MPGLRRGRCRQKPACCPVQVRQAGHVYIGNERMEGKRGMSGESSGHSYQLDFYKFFFACSILVLHTVRHLLPDSKRLNTMIAAWGNLSVHFFFVISGILMVNSYVKYRKRCGEVSRTPGKDSLSMILHKFWKMADIYYITFFMNYFLKSARFFVDYDPGKALSRSIRLMLQGIPELLVLHMSGIRTASMNPVTWYISAMLIAMLPLLFLLIRNKDTFLHIIAPLTAMVIFAWFYKGGDIFSNQNNWNVVVTIGVMRAVCGLCFGVLCWETADFLRSISERDKRVSRILTGLEAVLFVSFIYFWFIMKKDIKTAYPMMILIALLLAIAWSGKSMWSRLFEARCFRYLNKWSVYLFFTHEAALRTLENFVFKPDQKISKELAFASVTGLSVLLSIIVWVIIKLLKRPKRAGAGN